MERLLELGADVLVVDKLQLSTGSLAWNRKLVRLENIFKKHSITNIPLEICDLETDRQRFQIIASKADVVFHLSALFGGREFVDTRQADCSRMLAVDHNAIEASFQAGVERFHFASSACVYPNSLQTDPNYLLREDDILSTGEGWMSSDNLYGFAKLMGELQCVVFHKEKGLKTSACRYLTVYGPGEFDTSHAISALIEKALDRQDPYEVWGSGNQARGFTYVTDIVNGSIAACEKVEDGEAGRQAYEGVQRLHAPEPDLTQAQCDVFWIYVKSKKRGTDPRRDEDGGERYASVVQHPETRLCVSNSSYLGSTFE